MTDFFVSNVDGAYLGGGVAQPENSFQVPFAPDDASKLWDGEAGGWVHPVKIAKFTRADLRQKHFHDVNYKTELLQSLYPQRSFTFGTLNKVEWFSDLALTDKIITVDILYNYDGLGLAEDRAVTRTWYCHDGTPHSFTKITNKDYRINPQDQLDEAVRRRTNNVRQINIALIGLVPVYTTLTQLEIVASGQAFFDKYDHEENIFIKTGSVDLENAVKDEVDSQFSWFDADITALGIPNVDDFRDYIIYQLSAGLRNKNGTI